LADKINSAKVKRKQFAKAIVEGKSATQAYKEINPNTTYDSAKTQGSRMLTSVYTQEEIARLLSQVTPEEVTARIQDIALSAPLPETKLKALVALGNTRKASIFKDSTPSITNNTLNVFDLDDLRRRLADTSYNGQQITDQLT
jgi:hypothetical protein